MNGKNIGENTIIGENCEIGKNVILENVKIGNSCKIGDNVFLKSVSIDDYSIIQNNSIIGYDTLSGHYYDQKQKKDYSNNDIITSLRSNNIPIKVIFNNVERLEDLATKISNLIESDSLALMNSFIDDKFLKENSLTKESVFAIFLPNTYEFYWNTNADQFRDKMLKYYKMFWNSSRIDKAKSYGLNPVEVSVLASIVQRETPKIDERPTISGVYYNRLKKRMKLQADPTVVYAIKQKKGFDTKIRRVLYKDLKIKSPYNTYRNKGLPPGPIYMPDLSSIESVLNLESHSYLFFVADVKRPGYHMFANTLSQHNRNKRQYTSWLRKNKIKR